jgi:hypothetical protein
VAHDLLEPTNIILYWPTIITYLMKKKQEKTTTIDEMTIPYPHLPTHFALLFLELACTHCILTRTFYGGLVLYRQEFFLYTS